MSGRKRPIFLFAMVVFAILLAACAGVNSRSEPVDIGELQAVDETVLVQFGRSYEHSFPEGFYMEYALNDLGGQAVDISLVPVDGSDVALALFRAGDRTEAVLRLDEGGAGEGEATRFTPERGVNYRLQVYEVAGKTAAYELTLEP